MKYPQVPLDNKNLTLSFMLTLSYPGDEGGGISSRHALHHHALPGHHRGVLRSSNDGDISSCWLGTWSQKGKGKSVLPNCKVPGKTENVELRHPMGCFLRGNGMEEQSRCCFDITEVFLLKKWTRGVLKICSHHACPSKN